MNYYSLLKLEFFDQNDYCYSEYYYINVFIKVVFFIFLVYSHFVNMPIIKMNVDIDNSYNVSSFEQNINFSQYTTDIKVVALYYPRFQNLSERFRGLKMQLNEWKNINITTLTSNMSYHYPRKPGDEDGYLGYYDCRYEDMVLKQVELAKSHGIYGFGIFYYWFSGRKFLDKTIDIFLQSEKINFPFFLIWRNEDYRRRFLGFENDVFLVQNYSSNDASKLIKDVKKYLVSKKYVRIKGKPVLGIFDPSVVPEVRKFLSGLRVQARKNKIGEIYLLSSTNKLPKMAMKYFNAAFEIPPMHFHLTRGLKKNKYYYSYSSLIFTTKLTNPKFDNYTVFKSNIIEFDNTHVMNKTIIYDEFTPDKFYTSNRILLDYTSKKFSNSSDKFFFINGWNNWLEGSYLEPDENYGYASINALSKAIFNITYKNNTYNLTKLEKGVKVAIHAHVFYEDLIGEIINNTNNMPVKYDLYISTDTYEKKQIIEKYVKENSKARYYEVMVFKNKGRDMLPLLHQMKFRVGSYKYLCHIHTIKANNTNFGEAWRKYLLKNLLGSSDIISEILSMFETTKEIGFIYPDIFYKTVKLPFILNRNSTPYMNFFLNKMFPGHKISKDFKFPIGNMFWARIKAVNQAFDFKYVSMMDKNQPEDWNISSYGNEVMWLYIVKLNGYFFRTVFNGI